MQQLTDDEEGRLLEGRVTDLEKTVRSLGERQDEQAVGLARLETRQDEHAKVVARLEERWDETVRRVSELTGRFEERARPYRRQCGAVAVTVFVFGLLVPFVVWMHQSQREDAGAAAPP